MLDDQAANPQILVCRLPPYNLNSRGGGRGTSQTYGLQQSRHHHAAVVLHLPQCNEDGLVDAASQQLPQHASCLDQLLYLDAIPTSYKSWPFGFPSTRCMVQMPYPDQNIERCWKLSCKGNLEQLPNHQPPEPANRPNL